MVCKHCETVIPQKRAELGYRECVNCSTTPRWSANPVIFHKTGNTTEIIKDPELAADLAFASARKGFGVLKGMTANRRPKAVAQKKTESSKVTPIAALSFSRTITVHKPTYYFEEVGQEMMDIFEKHGYTLASQHIQKALEEKRIYRKQADQLSLILNTINHD
jgi:hypothetical protein